MWIEPEQQGQVSIHAPGRGATDSHIMRIVASFTFQFTHPGGVRRDVFLFQCFTGLVSIHAPGRGATRSGAHVASRRAGFNSRTREGCDRHSRF